MYNWTNYLIKNFNNANLINIEIVNAIQNRDRFPFICFKYGFIVMQLI